MIDVASVAFRCGCVLADRRTYPSWLCTAACSERNEARVCVLVVVRVVADEDKDGDDAVDGSVWVDAAEDDTEDPQGLPTL
jgi:hypothetical protein